MAAADVDALVDALGGGPEAQAAALAQLRAPGGLLEAALPRLLALAEGFGAAGQGAGLVAAELIGDLRRRSAARLSRAAAAAAEVLAAPDSAPALRAAALRALQAAGPEAECGLGAVVALLQDEDAALDLRCTAAGIVASIGEAAAQHAPAACAAVALGLHEGDAQAQLAATRAAGLLGAAAPERLRAVAAGAARGHATDEDADHRALAADALGELGDVAVPFLDNLAVLLGDDEVRVQCMAARALGRLGGAAVRHAAEAVDVAAFSVDNPTPEVRVAAAMALAMFKDLAASRLAPACQAMAAELDSRDSELRLSAAQAVGCLGCRAAAPHLARATAAAVELFEGGAPAVRLEAAIALAHLHELTGLAAEVGAEAACRLLQSSDWRERAAAARALAALGRDAAAFAAEAALALADPRAEVRDAIAAALAAMGREGAGHLAAGMRRPDWKVRTASSKALEALGFEGARHHATVNAMRDA